MSKKIFEFKDNGDSFVINNVSPPKDWCNYLWSKQGYIARVSHIGHGESCYIDKKANMCQLNNNEVRYIYLRDDESGTCWNIGEGPLLEPVLNYKCVHHISNTWLESEKDGIKSSLRIFVPFDGYCEIWTLKIKNNSNKKRKLSVFATVNFDLEGFKYPRYHEMFRTMNATYKEKLNGIYCSSAHVYAPHKRYNGYLAVSEKIFAYDANVAHFTGPVGSFANPQTLLEGADCTNSSRTCYDVGAVLQNKIELAAGEEKTIHYIYGLSESLEEAIDVTKNCFTDKNIEKTFEATNEAILSKYASLSIDTPDQQINDVMNNWLKKQVELCIVGKKGVRDNAQIASALLMYRPENARNEILEILRHQFKDGHAVLTWYPYDDTRYSDQPFWIVWIVIELIKETGDFSILDEVIEYQDGGKGTVLEHMKAAINRLLDDRGKNGLVKIFFADWNDALNVTDDPEAESVMLSVQFTLALKEMSILCDKTSDKEYASFLRERYAELRLAINKNAWDGDWYARVLSSKGNIGSKNSQGSKIYLNPQIWAILADLPDEKMQDKVIKSIDDMEHDFGFPINKPAYTEYSPHVGRMGLMLHGLYENGGVYCHASAFKIMADAKLGRGRQALRTLKKIIPDSEKNPYTQSETEPFVFTNCYALNPNCYGKADRSWTTGTSAWAMKGLYEGIMGIQKDYDGLRVDPCFPPNWEKAQITRTFRGARYHIQISNPEHISKAKVTISVDGEKIAGQILPLFSDDKVHKVEVILKKESLKTEQAPL
jgi:cellobiose phosphorylase